MENIGVTGAFGFLGANFVAALAQEGKAFPESPRKTRIVAFASKTRSNPLFSNDAVTVTGLNVLDRQSLTSKFAGLDAVVHFAGKVDYSRRHKKEVWDIDVLGAKNVFEAAFAAGVKRVVYISSICALGPGGSPSGGLADEKSAPYGNPGWPISFASPQEALDAVKASESGDYRFLERMRVAYFDAKLAGWELAKRYALEYGRPIVTVFPGTAVGPGDLHDSISRLVGKVWDGELRVAPGGATAFLDSRDCGEGVVLALRKGRPGEGYILAGQDGHNLRYAEFMGLIAKVARERGGRGAKRIATAPRGLSLAAASIAEAVLPSSGLSSALVLSGQMRNVCSSAKAMRDLGYAPRPSLEESIAACRNFGKA
jgi:dihydroflavonol-4-reductase